MKKSIIPLLLCSVLAQLPTSVFAESPAAGSSTAICFRNSQNIYPGTAEAGEYKVIHGPFNTRCGTTAHSFQLRHQVGSRLPVTVEQLVGGTWSKVIRNEYDPSRRLGNGTFRMILDNTASTHATPYRGSFSVPL
ncbi:MAG TPA: hypothetical protein VF682_19830 [Pseudomonas sp.]|jgi:hypothetical protein